MASPMSHPPPGFVASSRTNARPSGTTLTATNAMPTAASSVDRRSTATRITPMPMPKSTSPMPPPISAFRRVR